MMLTFFRNRRFFEGLSLVVLTLAVSAAPALAGADDDFIDLCGRGTPEAVRAAIDAGANVNARDDDRETALMEAAEKNSNPEVITVLLKAGADVNARDDDGETALIRAADESSNPEVVTVLLKAGANVNDRDEDGETALRKARERGAAGAAIADLLVRAGAKE